jgi:general secretion pathway protein G
MSVFSRIGHSLYQHRAAAFAGAFVLLLDQMSKDIAYTLWEDGGPVFSWGMLHLSRNPGLAFGFLGDLSHQLRLPLILITAFVAAFGISLVSRAFSGSLLRGWGLSLLFAGAIGNAIDRVWRGYVIDFIEPTLWSSLPSFNLADVSVTVGALLVALVVLLGNNKKSNLQGGNMQAELSMPEVVESKNEIKNEEARKAGALFKMVPGTTLVEILVVVAIIGLVMGAVAIGVIPLFAKGQKGVAWNDTQTYDGMYVAWQISHTDCPTSVEDLAKSAGKKGQSTKDPWGNDYVISCPSQHERDIDICSNGPDKQQGTDDDVCNWKPAPKD